MENTVKLVCEVCGDEFCVKQYRKETARYCSRSCRSKGCYPRVLQKGFTSKGRAPWNKGRPLGYIPEKAFKKGQVPWNKGTGCRTKNPEMYRLKCNMRCAIYRTLKGKQKSGHWEGILGYSLAKLKKHLEKHFKPGMTWENYGSKWWLDHTVPVSAFNFMSSKDHDFKRCWSLKNLRPMWAKENMVKNDSLENPFQPSLL